jgi:hypothetical protein
VSYSRKTVTRPHLRATVDSGPAFKALGEHMASLREDRPTADGTLLRGSMALDCARKCAFEALGVRPELELTTGQLVVFDVGQSYHDRIQAALAEHFGAQLEVVCSHAPTVDVSAHADAVYELAGDKVAVEIKSMKSSAWQLATGGNPYENTGAGPKKGHLIQAGIAATAPQVNAAFVHIIYINKDTGEVAEWLIDIHTPLDYLADPPPTIAELTRAELYRMNQIHMQLVTGTLPAREVPEYGLVDHTPPSPRSKNAPWNCRYCGFQPQCARLVPGETRIEKITWINPPSRLG